MFSKLGYYVFAIIDGTFGIEFFLFVLILVKENQKGVKDHSFQLMSFLRIIILYFRKSIEKT